MLNLKDLRKNLDILKKKLKERNVEFDLDSFSKKDSLNRDLIIKKEKLEQEKKILSKSKDQDNFIKSKKISEELSILTKKQNDSQNDLNETLYSFTCVSSIKFINALSSIANLSFKTTNLEPDNFIDVSKSIPLFLAPNSM